MQEDSTLKPEGFQKAGFMCPVNFNVSAESVKKAATKKAIEIGLITVAALTILMAAISLMGLSSFLPIYFLVPSLVIPVSARVWRLTCDLCGSLYSIRRTGQSTATEEEVWDQFRCQRCEFNKWKAHGIGL